MWRKSRGQNDRARSPAASGNEPRSLVDAGTQTEEDLFLLTAPSNSSRVRDGEGKQGSECQFELISNTIGDVLLSPVLTLRNPSSTNPKERRPIRDIDFHPNDPNIIIAAFDDSTSHPSFPQSRATNPLLNSHSPFSPLSRFSSSPQTSSNLQSASKSVDGVHVWHFHHRTEPFSTLTNDGPVNAVLWDTVTSQHAFGGSLSGQIVAWDLRSGPSPVQKSVSDLEKKLGHKEKICQIQHLENENYSLLGSVSCDGILCLWNKRMLSKPLETIELRNPSVRKSSISSLTTFRVCPSSVSFPMSSLQNSSFYVGCESGQIFQGNANEGLKLQFGQTGYEKNSFQFNKTFFAQSFSNMNKFVEYEKSGQHKAFVSSVNCHNTSFRKSDFDFNDLILTSSWDWTCKLWSSKFPSQSLYTFQDDNCFLGAKWSSQNPSLFAALNANGSVQLWDLGSRIDQPVVKSSLITSKNCPNYFPLPSKLCWSGDGCRIGIGDSFGLVHILTISPTLSLPSNDPKPFSFQIEKLTENLKGLQQSSE